MTLDVRGAQVGAWGWWGQNVKHFASLANLTRCWFPGKVFEIKYFHILIIKYKLIIKLITELVRKFRDKFFKTN